MDLKLLAAEPTDAERAAVDALLGPPESGWDGGARRAVDGHIARGGFRAAEQRRHLLLPALNTVQGAIGWISEGAMNYVCERLIVPPAEAYAVASFYALLATEPRPERVAHVCHDVVCGRHGGDDILEALRHRDDVIASPCLGQCDRGPAAMVQMAGVTDAVMVHIDADHVVRALDGDPTHAVPVTPPQVGDPSLRLLRRVGRVDPESLEAYRASGGYSALRKAMAMGGDAVIAEVKKSGLRGRGGAAFPMGIKWEAVANVADPVRYVICNADESEPGTFKDRVIMKGDPFALVEAITINGLAVGAERGYLYVRAEYPASTRVLRGAIEAARGAGLLGDDVAGSGAAFDIEIRVGAGAYICGEETALMNSIEGKRGEPRNKPPFPTQHGLFGKPTVINNVETLVNVLDIVMEGGDAFAALGTPESTGTKLFCVSGDVATPGVYEVEFGVTLGELLELSGGVRGELGAILLGGAAGVFVGPSHLDMPLTFEGVRSRGATLGSGVVSVFDANADFVAVLQRIAAFFRDESCGQCVPCRVGTVRQEELLARHAAGGTFEEALFGDIARAMEDASICGLGHTAASAIRSAARLGLIGGSP